MKEAILDLAGIATSEHQIGTIHQLRGEYETALEWYQKSLAILEELGDGAGVAKSRAQIAQLLVKTGRYSEAFPLLLLALSMFLASGSPHAQHAASELSWLRASWGEEPFDAAWREHTGEDLPDWLR